MVFLARTDRSQMYLTLIVLKNRQRLDWQSGFSWLLQDLSILPKRLLKTYS